MHPILYLIRHDSDIIGAQQAEINKMNNLSKTKHLLLLWCLPMFWKKAPYSKYQHSFFSLMAGILILKPWVILFLLSTASPRFLQDFSAYANVHRICQINLVLTHLDCVIVPVLFSTMNICHKPTTAQSALFLNFIRSLSLRTYLNLNLVNVFFTYDIKSPI